MVLPEQPLVLVCQPQTQGPQKQEALKSSSVAAGLHRACCLDCWPGLNCIFYPSHPSVHKKQSGILHWRRFYMVVITCAPSFSVTLPPSWRAWCLLSSTPREYTRAPHPSLVWWQRQFPTAHWCWSWGLAKCAVTSQGFLETWWRPRWRTSLAPLYALAFSYSLGFCPITLLRLDSPRSHMTFLVGSQSSCDLISSLVPWPLCICIKSSFETQS